MKKQLSTVIFVLLFQKPLWLLTYFYVVTEVDDFGRIYTSLFAQSQPRQVDETATGRIYTSLVV